MSLSLFAFLGFYLAVSLTVVVLSSILYRTYRYRFLQYFNLFLVSSYLYGFLDVLSSHFTRGLIRFHDATAGSLQLIGDAFHFLAMPFFVVSFYCLIRMAVEILSARFRNQYKVMFWAVEAVLMGTFLYLLVTIPEAGDTRQAASLGWFQHSFTGIHYVLGITVLIYMMHRLSGQSSNELAAHLKGFGAIYIVMFMARVGLLVFVENAHVICYVQPVLIFLMHIPPLIYLWVMMRRHAVRLDYDRVDPDLALDLFRKYGISEREQEVAWLIGAGKSNREIEEALCISIKTVKTHTYNIYRKLGINSRYQLMQLLQRSPLGENAASK